MHKIKISISEVDYQKFGLKKENLLSLNFLILLKEN